MRKTIIVALAAMFTGSALAHKDDAQEQCAGPSWLNGAVHTFLGGGNWRLCLAQDWIWQEGMNHTKCVKLVQFRDRAKKSRGRAMGTEESDWYVNAMNWYDYWLNEMHQETGKTRIGDREVVRFCRDNHS